VEDALWGLDSGQTDGAWDVACARLLHHGTAERAGPYS
jgi:hypothetical protein